MSGTRFSRRQFLQGSGTLAGSSLARMSLPALGALAQAACSARDAGAAFEILSNSEAKEVSAVAARIIPTTDTPGATEAGVIYFVDKYLATVRKHDVEQFRSLLAEFQSAVAEDFPEAASYADLSADQQDGFLAAHEDERFFGNLRFWTIAGFFSMSSYGGNRDNVGWKLIGLPAGHGGYQPPFGHYDADYMQGEQDGE